MSLNLCVEKLHLILEILLVLLKPVQLALEVIDRLLLPLQGRLALRAIQAR